MSIGVKLIKPLVCNFQLANSTVQLLCCSFETNPLEPDRTLKYVFSKKKFSVLF